MSRQNLEHLALAGLLHDIGKLFERGGVFEDARKDEHYLTFCPQDKGYPTYLHVAHTRAFCDWIEQRFDCLWHAEDRSWKDWCAAHHRNDETGIEASIIRISDRLSSSERETGQYYKSNIHRKTCLEPVLEKVFLDKNDTRFSTFYRVPLRPLTSLRESFFPLQGKELGLAAMKDADGEIKDPAHWAHLIAESPMEKEYADLCRGFMDEIEALSSSNRDISLPDLLTCLMTLVERYTANVPSATNLRHPDISLFDHLRTTAAIAQSLYLYHMEKPDTPLSEMDDPKWLMVCGDFSGIQKFIYNLTNKGAAKGLRGRSFYIQLFCRISADFMLRELNLTRTALLYNSGGKFYLLAPAHQKDSIVQTQGKINQWLLNEFNGDVFFGIGMAEITGRMFTQGEMHHAWKMVAESLDLDRMTKFREFLTTSFFEPETDYDPTKSCRVCGSRKIQKTTEACDVCDALARLGGWLQNTDAVLLVRDGAASGVEALQSMLNTKQHLSFSELGATAFFMTENQLHDIKNKPILGECLMVNRLGDAPFTDISLPRCGISSFYLGKWEKGKQVRKGGEPWDFEDYAENAEGIERLGVLRMDVDNLGLIFIQGLRFPERTKDGWGDVVAHNHHVARKSMASISRMAMLSRQLNHFFSAYVTRLLDEKDFNQCQVIYAGGDDLFIIGSWHQLPGLAKAIRGEFKAFCCENPDFSISGGLILQRGKYPIYKGAQLAGIAEKNGKEIRKSWGQASRFEKDGFSFLNTLILWEDMDLAEWIRDNLQAEIKENKGLMSYLSQMTAENLIRVQWVSQKTGKTESEAWRKIQYDAWRWRTAYQLRRRFSKKSDKTVIDKWSQVLFNDIIDGTRAALPVYTWLALPLRWTDYLNRKKGGK